MDSESTLQSKEKRTDCSVDDPKGATYCLGEEAETGGRLKESASISGASDSTSCRRAISIPRDRLEDGGDGLEGFWGSLGPSGVPGSVCWALHLLFVPMEEEAAGVAPCWRVIILCWRWMI